jgi:hypothetical protein
MVRSVIMTLGIASAVFGLRSPASGQQDAAGGGEDPCCVCTPDGEEHYFGDCDFCKLKPLPIECRGCQWSPEGHPGCHANSRHGSCLEHHLCDNPGADEPDTESLVALLLGGDERAFTEVVSSSGLGASIVLNRSRSAIQVLSCSGAGLVGHFPISASTAATIGDLVSGL